MRINESQWEDSGGFSPPSPLFLSSGQRLEGARDEVKKCRAIAHSDTNPTRQRGFRRCDAALVRRFGTDPRWRVGLALSAIP